MPFPNETKSIKSITNDMQQLTKCSKMLQIYLHIIHAVTGHSHTGFPLSYIFLASRTLGLQIFGVQ